MKQNIIQRINWIRVNKLIYRHINRTDQFACYNTWYVAGIANLENSEGGGISVEGGLLVFRLRGVFLENTPTSKRREKSEVRLLALLMP